MLYPSRGLAIYAIGAKSDAFLSLILEMVCDAISLRTVLAPVHAQPCFSSQTQTEVLLS